MSCLDDEELSGITGQAGVNFNVDVTMNISIETSAWGDSDGLVPGYANPWPVSGSGGYMGMNHFFISQLHVRSRETDSFSGYDAATMWKPVTIDVARSDTLYDGSTFVRIGLGAMHISWDHMDFEVALGTAGDSLNQKLGDFSMGELSLYLNPASYIDIYNNRGVDTSGVTMTWYSIVDRIDIASIAWGDSDGLGALSNAWIGNGTSAGWVGLRQVAIDGPTSVIGSFAIDVVTARGGMYAQRSGRDETIVHISFPTDFSLHTERLAAEVRLDSDRSLNSPNATILGDIFLEDFTLQIQKDGFVDIWAH